jgi:hypothetical protein
MLGSYYSNRTKLGVDDTKRAGRALHGIEAKRLTYRRARGARPQPDEAPFWAPAAARRG